MTTEPRLKTELWVKAFIRRCWSADVPALLLRRGETDSGTIMLKMNGGAADVCVYARGLLADGSWGWRRASGPKLLTDQDADAYVERQLKYDSDIWVIEVESADITRFVDDPVELA